MHPFLRGAAVVTSAALLTAIGCQSQGPTAPPEDGAVAGSAHGAGTSSGGRLGSGGTGGTAGSVVMSSGGTSTAGSGTSTGGTGGTVMTTGGMGSGGMVVSTGGTGGSTSGGMGSGGMVVSTGGTTTAGSGGTGGTGTGGGGAGGMTSSGGMAGKPCVDVEPPPDPDWPDATCENWANETTECTAAWFAGYCDASCHRCTPAGSGGAAGMSGVDCSTQGLPNVSGGNGYATRYWDCCQPHCSQFDGHRCGQDGVSSTGDMNSACSGGGSFACYDEAPHAVNDCLSYGFIAKANPNCGGCYRIQFTGEGQYSATDPGSKAIKGKQMIVKVSNTGGDVAQNQFDLMIPGGGVGQNNACSRQWGTSDLGAQYGGFLTNCTGTYAAKKDCVRQNCMKIPAGKARDGCIWFVDWFQAADNPKFTSQATDCPF
jgi:hypothetical protein